MHIESKPFSVTEVLVAGNRGPCGGVKMAQEATEQVLQIVDGREPVYTLWDIVNNTPTMNRLKEKGLINVNNDWSQISEGGILVYPAHGKPRRFIAQAAELNLLTVDVTCQLVNRVHTLVRNAQAKEMHIVYIGKEGHPESEGVLGELEAENVTFLEPNTNIDSMVLPEGKEIIVYSQTTLATDEVKQKQLDLKNKFPKINIPPRWDICPAVDIRQGATEDLLDNYPVDFLLVGGSFHSHNSKEMVRKAKKRGIPHALVDDPNRIKRRWFTEGVKVVGATASASEAEEDFQEILDVFRSEGIDPVIYIPKIFDENDKTFTLPQKDIDALQARYN